MRYEFIVWMSDSLEFCSYWLYRILLWWEIWKSKQVYYLFCCHCNALSTILHFSQPVWWISQACWALECAENDSFKADLEAQQEAFGQDTTTGSLRSMVRMLFVWIKSTAFLASFSSYEEELAKWPGSVSFSGDKYVYMSLFWLVWVWIWICFCVGEEGWQETLVM